MKALKTIFDYVHGGYPEEPLKDIASVAQAALGKAKLGGELGDLLESIITT